MLSHLSWPILIPQIQRDIKAKERARENLSRRYRSSTLSDEDILQCLYALSDNNSYLLFNRWGCGGYGHIPQADLLLFVDVGAPLSLTHIFVPPSPPLPTKGILLIA